jgi:hypothetical protein
VTGHETSSARTEEQQRTSELRIAEATAQQLVSFTASNATDHVRFDGRLDDHDVDSRTSSRAAAALLTKSDRRVLANTEPR